VALGSDLVASARVFLIELHRSGQKGLKKMIASWEEDLRSAMFLTGSRTLDDLRHAPMATYSRP
jgi:isopentenyl diphosphate isomerase/L-lactate dehydrogenase-like FMN-dependent dehydrogenase